MATIQELLDDGWKEYPSGQLKDADMLLQKVVRSGDKKAYYLNALVYHLHTFPNGTTFTGRINCEAVMYCVEKDVYWFKVELHDCQDKSLKDIYKFFYKIYYRMKCIPDIHNND